jgi:hypothetical protein
MKFFAVLHNPTGKLFPHMESGASYFEFNEPDHRRRGKRFPRPPRLFSSQGHALRYITEYCKGSRAHDSFGKVPTYADTAHPRSIYDFSVVEITLDYTVKIKEPTNV